MATAVLAQTASKLITTPISLGVSTLRYTAANPLLSGALLWLLTKAPADVQARVLGPLRARGLTDSHITKIVWTLKYLLYFGIGQTLNDALNRLALNYWHFKRPGAPWKFGDASKSELVLITGGCSGFGKEMVKGFAGKARVIILDISDLPADLEKRKYRPGAFSAILTSL
jgi:all-trans-retinol dehydrogenase (NAD+)